MTDAKDERAAIVAIKEDWLHAVDVASNMKGSSASVAIALWATLNVDRLIDLALSVEHQEQKT
jgi:hypothetical protein